MSFWKKIFGGGDKPEPTEPCELDAVILHIVMESDPVEKEVRHRWYTFQDELAAAVGAAGVGVLDGDGWGFGGHDIFLYGPNADALWDAIAPIIEKQPMPKGSHAIKRYQTPKGEREERIDLWWDG